MNNKKILLLIITLNLVICYFSYKNLNLNEETIDDTYCTYEEISSYISIKGDIKQKYIDNVTDSVNTHLPTYIFNDFRNNDWKICITNNIGNLEEDNRNIVGLTDFKEKTIYILATDYASKYTILHEFGHYFDIKMHNKYKISKDDDFINIYNDEKDNFKSANDEVDDKYSRKNSCEYFAACFEEYICFNNNLKEKCPMTYDYINNILYIS